MGWDGKCPWEEHSNEIDRPEGSLKDWCASRATGTSENLDFPPKMTGENVIMEGVSPIWNRGQFAAPSLCKCWREEYGNSLHMLDIQGMLLRLFYFEVHPFSDPVRGILHPCWTGSNSHLEHSSWRWAFWLGGLCKIQEDSTSHCNVA